MTKETIDIYFEEKTKRLKKAIYYPVFATVLGGVIMMCIMAIWTYFGKIKANEVKISTLQHSKVDVKAFNEYLNTQNKINTLSEERIRILTGRLDAIDNKIERLNQIDIEITRLQEKLKNILNAYGMKTRAGEEVTLGLDWHLQPTNI